MRVTAGPIPRAATVPPGQDGPLRRLKHHAARGNRDEADPGQADTRTVRPPGPGRAPSDGKDNRKRSSASGGRGAVGPPDPPSSSGTFEPAAKAPPSRNSRPDGRLKKGGGRKMGLLKKNHEEAMRWREGRVSGRKPVRGPVRGVMATSKDEKAGVSKACARPSYQAFDPLLAGFGRPSATTPGRFPSSPSPAAFLFPATPSEPTLPACPATRLGVPREAHQKF